MTNLKRSDDEEENEVSEELNPKVKVIYSENFQLENQIMLSDKFSVSNQKFKFLNKIIDWRIKQLISKLWKF